jgi:hypothetical protein
MTNGRNRDGGTGGRVGLGLGRSRGHRRLVRAATTRHFAGVIAALSVSALCSCRFASLTASVATARRWSRAARSVADKVSCSACWSNAKLKCLHYALQVAISARTRRRDRMPMTDPYSRSRRWNRLNERRESIAVHAADLDDPRSRRHGLKLVSTCLQHQAWQPYGSTRGHDRAVLRSSCRGSSGREANKRADGYR